MKEKIESIIRLLTTRKTQALNKKCELATSHTSLDTALQGRYYADGQLSILNETLNHLDEAMKTTPAEAEEETKNYEVVTCECGTVHPVEFSTPNDEVHWNCPKCIKMYLTEELNQRDAFAMKFFIWTDNEGRSLVPNMTASMLLKEYKDWLAEQEEPELLPPTPAEKELTEAIEVIKMISSNEHLNLGDMIYNVREREGLGWEGPSVIAWGAAVDKINAIKKRLEE